MISGHETSPRLIGVIESIGLSHTEQIKHLGIKIDNNLNNLQENWVDKIKICEYKRINF